MKEGKERWGGQNHMKSKRERGRQKKTRNRQENRKITRKKKV